MPSLRGMPWGVALFVVYALAILAGVGLSFGFVVDQAENVPVTPLGLVVMALLAYTIFTVTVVLQRKAAARNLALGLATLALPAIPWPSSGASSWAPWSSWPSLRSCSGV